MRWTCAWHARAASPTARPTSTWPPTRRSSSPTTTPAGCDRAPTTPWAGFPPPRRLIARLAAAGAGQRGHARHGRCAGSRRAAAGLEDRPHPAFAAQTLQQWWAARAPGGRGGRPRHRAAVAGHFHQLLPPRRSAARRSKSSSGPAGRSTMPPEPLCCGLTWISTGQLRTREEGPAPDRRARSRPTCATAGSCSASSRAARPSSAPTRPSCSPTTRTWHG